MKRTLGSVRLKSGEDMTIVHAVAPEGDYGLDIPEFMHVRGPFKEGSAWHRYLVRAWRGELADRVRVSFCVGEIDGEKVGVVGYSAPETTLDVCTWGHVVTRSDQTGKGIATALTAASIEEFRELRDGPRAMFLSTGSDGAPPARVREVRIHRLRYRWRGRRDVAADGRGLGVRAGLLR